MDDRTWWKRHNPREWLRIWRWRHSLVYRSRMQGYWEGRVCRFCDHAYSEQPMCDIPGKPCDFRVGVRRGLLGPR